MTENTNKRRPAYAVYTINGDGPGATWTQIGVAFPHKDGMGLSVAIDGPIPQGRVSLRAIQAPRIRTEPAQPPFQVELPDPRQRAA